MAERLRPKASISCDSLTGMDWGEALGVVYHLEATSTGENG